jgi:hypothetical protein
MTLSVVTGLHAGSSAPSVALSGSLGVGQVSLLFATGGGLPGSATVTDNVNSGNYSVLASFVAQNMMIFWKVTNASGTPTITINTPGGFTDIWGMGVTGFVGTPTADTGINATATGTSTTPTLAATSNFANEIMLMAVGTAYTQQVTATGWSAGTTSTDHNFNAMYAIEASPTTNNFNGTWGTSQAWALQLAGIYDPAGAPVSAGVLSLAGQSSPLGLGMTPGTAKMRHFEREQRKIGERCLEAVRSIFLPQYRGLVHG